MSNNSQYNFIAKLLHWLVAGLIVAQYILIELSEWAKDGGNVVERLALLANHKSIGMTILALAVIRLVWRLFNKPPTLPSSMPKWQHLASHSAHWLIYLLIFCLPLSGWLMSSANAYSVSWFNVFVFPDLVAADKSYADLFHFIHEIMTEALFVVVVIHIAAALKHHFVDKDGVLGRMASPFGWVLLVATLVLVIALFGRLGSSGSDKQVDRVGSRSTEYQTEASNSSESLNQTEVLNPAEAPNLAEAPDLAEALSELSVWEVDYSASYIKFTADQAGAPFEGVWEQWQAVMQFDAQQLDKSAFNVTIDTTQVNSQDQERDGYILGEDFFDTTVFKTATFTATEFEAQSDAEFTSNARLSIKGLSKAVLFTFSVKYQGDSVELLGSASLDRLAWNVGTGDWTDTSWVGQDVAVSVKVVATVKAQ